MERKPRKKTDNPMLTIHNVEKFEKRILEHSGSYRQFAKNCGVCSDTTLRRAVKTGYLSLHMAKGISQYLGVTLYDLLEYRDAKELARQAVVKVEPPKSVLDFFSEFAEDLAEAGRKLLGAEDKKKKKPKKDGKKTKKKKSKKDDKKRKKKR